MKCKAQAGLEMVLVSGFVLFFIVLALAAYFEVGDTTIALVILKERTIAALQQEESFHFVSDMNFEIQSSGELHLTVSVRPRTPSLSDSVKNQILQSAPAIAQKTRFSSVIITIDQ